MTSSVDTCRTGVPCGGKQLMPAYFSVQKKKATKMSAHLNNSQHGSEMGKV